MKTLGSKILKGSAIFFFVLAGFYLILGVKVVIEERFEMLATLFGAVCLFSTIGGLLLRKYNQKKEKNDNFGNWKNNA